MKFSEIIGNPDAKDYLIKSINEKHILHSYLFLGTEGIGKLLIAKEFAKKILCLEDSEDNCTCKSCICFNGNNNPDFSLINESGDNIKIDTIRDLTSKIIEKPIVSNRKVYIINDFEKMTKEAQNCLLKTLEEPPEFVTIILIGSKESSFLSTIKSRCTIIKFSPIENEQIIEYLNKKYEIKNITEEMLEIFGGSIGKAEDLKDKEELFSNIIEIVEKIKIMELPEVLKKADIIYKSQEDRIDILEAINVILFKLSKQDIRYLNCIDIVEDTTRRLNANANYNMSIDNMIFRIWEEMH